MHELEAYDLVLYSNWYVQYCSAYHQMWNVCCMHDLLELEKVSNGIATARYCAHVLSSIQQNLKYTTK